MLLEVGDNVLKDGILGRVPRAASSQSFYHTPVVRVDHNMVILETGVREGVGVEVKVNYNHLSPTNVTAIREPP